MKSQYYETKKYENTQKESSVWVYIERKMRNNIMNT